MDTDARLLEILSLPGTHSGTKIGEDLGMSRVAVKKRISALIDDGLPVSAIAGKGYSLHSDVQLLSRSRILDCIEPLLREHISSLEVHRSLPSTNAHLLATGTPEIGRASIVIAESQPQGKGRRGRGWVATPYRNLMMSLGWRYERWPSNPSALSLAFAVAVHRALVDNGVETLSIKWPNDILLGGKKLGGLLVDARGEASGSCDLVFGVGLNFYIGENDAQHIDQEWTDLSRSGYTTIDRNRLAANISSNLIEAIKIYQTDGFAPFVTYWNTHAAYVDQPVRLFNETEEHQGELRGVDESGELVLLSKAGKELRFNQAEISLRPL